MEIKVRENRRNIYNQEWTIQRNWQHWVQKIRDEDKQIKKHNTEHQNDEHHGPHQNPGMNPGVHEG